MRNPVGIVTMFVLVTAGAVWLVLQAGMPSLQVRSDQTTSTSPSGLSNTISQTGKSASGQLEGMGGIDLDSGINATMLIEDSTGRRTGRDAETNSVLQEIPQSAYSEERLDNASTGAVGLDVDHAIEITQPIERTYSLQLTGIEQGSYDLYVRTYSMDGSSQPPIEQKGEIDVGSTIAFQFDYNSAPGAVSTLTQLVP